MSEVDVSEIDVSGVIQDFNRTILSIHKINDAYEFKSNNVIRYGILEKFQLNCFGEICLGLRVIASPDEVSFKDTIYYIHPYNLTIGLKKLT